MLNVFVYIDALPLSHINSLSTPFLNKLKNGSTSLLYDLKNIMGYSFAIQSTILSGELPQKTGHWMPYFYAPESATYLHRTLAHMAQRMKVDLFHSRAPLFLRYLRIGLMPLVVFRRGVKINSMPLRVLDRFCTYEYYFMNDLPFYIDFKEELNNSFGAALSYFGPPLDRDPVGSLISCIRKLRAQNREICDALVIVYLERLDGIGHEYGTRSREWARALSEIDNKIEYLYRFLVKETKFSNLMVFSDHGTSDVAQTIDIVSYLSRKRIDVWKDLTFFIDATITLIWTETENLRETVIEAIKDMGAKVTIFDRETDSGKLAEYGVPFEDRRFGDIVVQTAPGFMFFPNFYSDTKPLKGTHGFLPTEEHQRSFMLLVPNPNSGGIKRKIGVPNLPVHIKDIRRFLLGLFE